MLKTSSRKVKLITLCMLLSSSTVSAFEPFKVTKIQINGIKQVSRDAVTYSLPIKVGDVLKPADTAKILNDVYDSGLFETVDLKKKGTVLIVDVTERPIISEIKIKGVKQNSQIKEILRDNQVIQGHMFDPNKLEMAAELIERHYISKGNFGVTVESKVTPAGSGVELTVDIFEGEEAKVKQIKIIGNSAFKEKELKKVMMHSSSNFLSWYTKSDKYAREKLLADVEAIRSFYLDHGFVNIQIESAQVSLSPNKKKIFITIRVNEGAQYSFGAMKVSGDLVVPRERLTAILDEKIKEGEVFSRSVVSEVKNDMEKVLGADGFSKAEVRLDFDANDISKQVNIDFSIIPNKRMMVREISFDGNNLTKDSVLRRNVPQLESTWISTDLLEFGRETIERQGYSKNVTVKTEPVPGVDDQLDVVYKVEEQKTTRFSAGVQYSSADKLILNFGAEMVNFLGTGKDIDFTFERSKAFSNYSFGYFNPDFYGDNVGMGYSLYFRKTELSKSSNIFDFTSHDRGASVYWTFPLTKYDIFVINFGYDKTKLLFNQAARPVEISDFITQEGTSFKEWSLLLKLKHNSQDKYIFPTKGLYQAISFKYVAPWSDLKYYRLDYDVSWNRPVYKNVVFNAGATLGYANRYGSTKVYPFYKNYYTGGAESVRGFEDRTLGPKDSQGREFGGNALINLRTSLNAPPPFSDASSSLRLSLFLEAGQVYNTITKTRTVNGVTRSVNPNGIRASVGVAVKWYTPLGVPLEFSLAKPLNKKPGDQERIPAFSFGMVFN